MYKSTEQQTLRHFTYLNWEIKILYHYCSSCKCNLFVDLVSCDQSADISTLALITGQFSLYKSRGSAKKFLSILSDTSLETRSRYIKQD